MRLRSVHLQLWYIDSFFVARTRNDTDGKTLVAPFNLNGLGVRLRSPDTKILSASFVEDSLLKRRVAFNNNKVWY